MHNRNNRTRKVFRLGLKILVSGVFIAYLCQELDWADVWQRIESAHPGYLSLYLSLGLVAILIGSLKWQVLFATSGIRPALHYLISLYLVGFFFNNFLPTSLGGDFVRGYTLGKAYDRPAAAMASVFVERFSGYTTLVVFGSLAITLDSGLRTDPRFLIPIATAVLAYLVILWMILNKSWLSGVPDWGCLRLLRMVSQKAIAFQQAIGLYKHEPRALITVLAWSALFYVLSVIMVYVGCMTFHTSVSFLSLFTAVPVLLILFMIPFSFGGIGVQEWAYYFVLRSVGVPVSVSISLGLLFRLRSVLFGLLGAALWYFVAPGDVWHDSASFSNRSTGLFGMTPVPDGPQRERKVP